VALLRPALKYEELRDADIVIEAVFEEMGVKKEVFSTLDRVMKPAPSSPPTPRPSMST